MMVPQWLGINPANSFANLNDHAMPSHQNLDAKLDFVLKFTWLRQRFSFWKFWIKVYAQLKLMPLLDTYGMIVEHEALGIAWTWSDILRCMQGICPKGMIHLPTLRELKASCVGREGRLHGCCIRCIGSTASLGNSDSSQWHIRYGDFASSVLKLSTCRVRLVPISNSKFIHIAI